MRRICKEYDTSPVFDGASRPNEGRFAHHIGFTMRTVTGTIPSQALAIGTHKKVSEKCPMPRACRLQKTNLDFSTGFPHELLISVDGAAAVQVLSLKSGETSRRMVSVDGDTVWFIHKGSGSCNTVLGRMNFQAPTYLFVPRSFTYQIIARNNVDDVFMVGMESREPLERPQFGRVNDTVPWDEHRLVVPEPTRSKFIDTGEEGHYKHSVYSVWVKRAGEWTEIFYKHSPFSCIGYQGYPYPFILDFENISLPILSKEHTDPTSFMTFCSPPPYDGERYRNMPNVAISTFLSHRMYSPPYFHTNLWDEALFISGDYPARGGVLGPGDMSFHPQGFPHGPQPSFLKQWKEPAENAPLVEMRAVIFESRTPLVPTPSFLAHEIPGYWKTWTEDV